MHSDDADRFLDGIRISAFPYVVVRIDCHLCPRRGAYRLGRIAERYGADAPLVTVLQDVGRDCPWRRPPEVRRPGNYEAKCGAKFTDLDRWPPESPDLPPATTSLRLVTNKGKRVA